MANILTIPINVLSTRGVILESLSDLKESFFADVYGQALNTIALIIKNNENEEASSKQMKKPYFVQNTIAFSGRRGTGKTSVMNTVCHYLLTNKPGEDGFCDPAIKAILDKVDFYSIPQMIDASHLDENEDLFEVIIAYLIKDIKKIKESKDFDEEKHGEKADDLSRKLAKMQNDYDSLIQTNNKTIQTSYEVLVRGADKHLIQYDFKTIIDDYLKFKANCSFNKVQISDKSKYLIICVDDIDMYPGDPVQILQCIYRYFMLPNMIVLTSLNSGLLVQYIYKHYFDKLASKRDNSVNMYFSDGFYSQRNALCQEQSNEYFRKIVPIDMRIIMPSWKKSDYKDLIKKDVRLVKQNQIKEIDKSFPNLIPGRFYTNICRKINRNEQTMSVKEFIFQLLADRTGIYLDATGNKAHFMEPDSLRNMIDLFYTLYSMNNIRINGVNEKKYTDNNKDKIRQNYKTILDTFYFKILPNLELEDAEPGLFEYISREPITRRNKIIIDYYHNYLRTKEPHINQDNSNNSVEAEKGLSYPLYTYYAGDYCIGELFKVLHNSSRNNCFSKDMIKAILASYSFKLPYLYDEGIYYYEEKIKKSKEENKEAANYINPFHNDYFKPLLEVFGDSLLGSWNRDLFMGKRLRWYIDPSVFMCENKNDINLLIKYLLFVRLDDLQKDEYIQFSHYKKVNGTDKVLSPEEKKHCSRFLINYDLDITAFIINIIRFDEFESVVKKSLEFIIPKENESSIVNEAFNDYHEKIDNIVVRKKEQDNSEENKDFYYPLFPYPIHQMDIAYNVIKRAIKEIVYVSDSSLDIRKDRSLSNQKEILDTIQHFYQNILAELNKVKQRYPLFNNSDEDDTKDNNIFAQTFFLSGGELGIWESNSEFANNIINLKNDNGIQFVLMSDNSDVTFSNENNKYDGKWEKKDNTSFKDFFDYLNKELPEQESAPNKLEEKDNEEQFVDSQ